MPFHSSSSATSSVTSSLDSSCRLPEHCTIIQVVNTTAPAYNSRFTIYSLVFISSSLLVVILLLSLVPSVFSIEGFHDTLQQIGIQGNKQYGCHQPNNGNIKIQGIKSMPHEMLNRLIEVSRIVEPVSWPYFVEVDGIDALHQTPIVFYNALGHIEFLHRIAYRHVDITRPLFVQHALSFFRTGQAGNQIFLFFRCRIHSVCVELLQCG